MGKTGGFIASNGLTSMLGVDGVVMKLSRLGRFLALACCSLNRKMQRKKNTANKLKVAVNTIV